jgi:ATP-binding cassette subfamily G (WHITE) protein 2 (PDR)
MTRKRSRSLRRTSTQRDRDGLGVPDAASHRISDVPELPTKDFKKEIGPDSSDDAIHDEMKRDTEVHRLARKLTKQSTYSSVEDNPLEAGEDSPLNPNSHNFNAKAWAKSLHQLQMRDSRNPQRTAGVAFRNLNAFGYGAATDYQKTVSNVWLQLAGYVRKLMGAKDKRIDILQHFDGLVNAGEMLVVLGPPGSGCTTLLKTISGETHGFHIDKESYLNYQGEFSARFCGRIGQLTVSTGISAAKMKKDFRGECIYTAEVDVHFPQLSVNDTLTFAARARVPRNPPGGVSQHDYADHMRDVYMAIFGISHTKDTVVGNDYVRGVSGGERKRVTIAEAALSGAPLQCWDNSTRGLDSANAVEFCKTLRLSTDILGATACVSIYQAPQSAYDFFDKVIVLYRGRQIFFGRTTEAKQFFVDMGFECPDRQTTADFLTSMTSPQERVVREGWASRVPRTPDDFAVRWKESANYKRLQEELEAYDTKYPIGGESFEKFKESRKAQQAKHQ